MSSLCTYRVEGHQDKEAPAVSRLLTASGEGKGYGISATQLDGVMESRRNVAPQTKGAEVEQKRSERGGGGGGAQAAESKQKFQCRRLEVVEPVLSITL